jgi:hypothetical protein
MELADQPSVARGRVLSVSPTSDFGASKHRVRVAVENAAGWPSGLVAWVRFTEPGPEWQELVAEAGPREVQDAESGAPGTSVAATPEAAR